MSCRNVGLPLHNKSVNVGNCVNENRMNQNEKLLVLNKAIHRYDKYLAS